MSPRARLLLVLLLLATAAVCVRLGLWQRDRLQQRRARNAAVEAARALAPLALPGHGAARAQRRVVAQGAYDHGHEQVLRGQAYRENPGVYVVTPLRLAGTDSAVLVVRGYAPAADGTNAALDSLAEPGPQAVTGPALPLGAEAAGGQPLVLRDGRTSWRALDLAGVRARVPYPLLDVLVVDAPRGADDPRRPRRVEPVALSDGPHFSYLVQWFSFAAIALVTAAVIGLRRGQGTVVPPMSAPEGDRAP